MSHSFTVNVTDILDEQIKKTASEITARGGSFEGNTESGSFQVNSVVGPIKCEYCRIPESGLRFTITEKPSIVPYSLIESEIKKYFS